VARQWYYPYGAVRGSVGTLPTQRTFTGQYSDATGLMYFNARYYSHYLNRWLQPDSIVPEPSNPQDLNRYTFNRNNPVKYVDPTGHDPCTGVAGTYEPDCGVDGWTGPDDDGISPDDDWLDLAWQWFWEMGPEERYFDGSTWMVQQLMNHAGVNRARNTFLTLRDAGRGPSEGKPYYYDYDFGPEGYVNAWKSLDGVGHFLGSYSVQITDLGTGKMRIRVQNETNWQSGTNLRGPGDLSLVEAVHVKSVPPEYATEKMYSSTMGYYFEVDPFRSILPKWERGETFGGAINIGGNVTQIYEWEEPLTVSHP